jgi:hypothetical protein
MRVLRRVRDEGDDRALEGPACVALPIAGGLTFAVLVAVWFTSAFWFAGQQGWPPL